MADIVSDEQWREARLALLAKEKAFSRERDALAAERMKMPWRRIPQDYAFDTPDGERTLAHLFGDASQLIVYHFMLAPGWPQGCKNCSLIADHYDPLVLHLGARDARLVTISRAPLGEIEAYQKRMGWSFPWVSSHGTSFNQDFGVTITQAQEDAEYNYRPVQKPGDYELPGLSIFARDESGEVFHTYSVYARGLEDFLGIYRFLDVLPKGRDENPGEGMGWVRHNDSYGGD